jgi:hypothetical protein
MTREMIVLLIAAGLSGAVMAKPLPESGERTESGEHTESGERTEIAPQHGTESRSSKFFEDLGIDLVVSKVKFTRGRFAGEYKLQIVPYVKNMCNEGTTARFDVYVPFVIKEWITGIGPKQEKSAGAFYRSSNPESAPTHTITVTVDHDGVVDETEEANNTCEDARVSFAAGETGPKTYNCTIHRSRCRRYRQMIDKERELQIRPRPR